MEPTVDTAHCSGHEGSKRGQVAQSPASCGSSRGQLLHCAQTRLLGQAPAVITSLQTNTQTVGGAGPGGFLSVDKTNPRISSGAAYDIPTPQQKMTSPGVHSQPPGGSRGQPMLSLSPPELRPGKSDRVSKEWTRSPGNNWPSKCSSPHLHLHLPPIDTAQQGGGQGKPHSK
jgi:hypothetical protein